MTTLANDPAAHVVVVGGGIAGLTAADRLLTLRPDLRLTLIEADDRFGGKIVTERADGFVIEGGPDSFLAAKPHGVGLCRDLGLDECLRGPTPRPRRAYVLRDERLHELPEGLSGLVPTKLGPIARSDLLSARGKARLALDYALPVRAGDDDEPLGGFVRRRLGDEAWERLVEPLMAGIYAGDGDRLSLLATFPQLRRAELEHGGLIKGVLAAKRAAPAPAAPRPAFLAPADGLDGVVHALVARLRAAGATLETGVGAREIRRRGERAEVALRDGRRLAADAVIAATPAFAAGEALARLDPALAAELHAIPYASSAIVSLAFPRDRIAHPLDGHGYLIPRAAGSPILACTWASEKWAGRAPEGWALLRVFVGRFGRAEILSGTDEDLIAAATAEVATRLGATGAPAVARVQRWPLGMPQYVLGHPERLRRIEAALGAHPWLALAGNAYRGVGLPDAIASGQAAAERVAAWLAAPVWVAAAPELLAAG